MKRIERDQIKALARKSEALRKVWLRERQEIVTEQLAANAEVIKQWEKGELPPQSSKPEHEECN